MTSLSSALLELDLPRHKSEFYNSWRLGYHAGLPHGRTLATVGDFKRSRTVAKIRNALLRGAERKQTVGQVLKDNLKLFDSFEGGVLALAEESGGFEEALGLLAGYFAAEYRAVQTVKRWLAYPMATGVAAIFVVSFPVLFFGDVVRYVLIVSAELVAAFLFAGAILSRVARWHRSRREFVVGRFCRALAMGVEAGLPLAKVTEFAVAAAGHPDLTTHLEKTPRLERGRQPLAKTFAGSSVLPFEVLAALEVADTTGNYGDTLGKLARLYDGNYEVGSVAGSL